MTLSSGPDRKTNAQVIEYSRSEGARFRKIALLKCLITFDRVPGYEPGGREFDRSAGSRSGRHASDAAKQRRPGWPESISTGTRLLRTFPETSPQNQRVGFELPTLDNGVRPMGLESIGTSRDAA